MIYTFNNREKLSKAISQFQAKYPAAIVARFDSDTFATKRQEFEDRLASGANLFADPHLLVLDDVELSDEEEANIKASETKVLWFRRELSPAAEFSFYALSDALAARDRGQSWLGYQRALRAGVNPEEVYWRALVWRVKKLVQAGGGRAYSLAEARALSGRLVDLWHQTKREAGRDFGLELEQLLLTL